MNESTQRLSRAFIERNDEAYVRDLVSHTPEAVREFADLTARLVELEEQPHLTIHRPTRQSVVRARIWSEQPRVYGHGCDGQPDRGTQESRFVAEVYLRPYGDSHSGNIQEQTGLLEALTMRRVNTGERQTLHTDGGYCNEVQMYQLSVNPQELPEMSHSARIVCEALQHGIPLYPVGETEPRPAHMRYVRYNAGHGRIGTPAENGYVLARGNDIYVVPTIGEFCMDEHDHVVRTFNDWIPQSICFDCDDRTTLFSLRQGLEATGTLAGHDLTGRRVFFVASGGRECGDIPRAIEMLQERGATVHTAIEEDKTK